MILEKVLPVPGKVVEVVTEQLRKIDPEIRNEYFATLIINASEQRIDNQDEEKQRKDFSGKKNTIAENFKSSSLKVS